MANPALAAVKKPLDVQGLNAKSHCGGEGRGKGRRRSARAGVERGSAERTPVRSSDRPTALPASYSSSRPFVGAEGPNASAGFVKVARDRRVSVGP